MKERSCIIITHQQSLDSAGGGTLICLEIAHHLSLLGIEVIIVPRFRPHLDKPIIDFKELPCEVVPAPCSRVHYLLNGLSVAKIVRRLLDEKNVDAVLSWDYEAAFLPKLLRSKGVVFGMIAAEPSYEMWQNRKTALRSVKFMTDEWFRWRPLKQADVVFTLSNFTQKELVKLFKLEPNRIVNIYNGIDSRFQQIHRSFTGEISNFIFYGSLAPLKGIFDVIEALGCVAAKGHKEWVLKVAGWGDEALVRQALCKYGIEDRVILLGRLELQELVPELAWAHIAILPSRAESFGRAIAEAQASMLPVISCEVGSIPEVVEKDVTGWLVPPQRVDRLAEAIIEAIQKPEKTFRMGVAGRERMTQLFSWEKSIDAILQGIEEAKTRRAQLKLPLL